MNNMERKEYASPAAEILFFSEDVMSATDGSWTKTYGLDDDPLQDM